jgi:hypothetical protein
VKNDPDFFEKHKQRRGLKEERKEAIKRTANSMQA